MKRQIRLRTARLTLVIGLAIFTMALTVLGGCGQREQRDRRPRSVPIKVGQTVKGQLDSADHADIFGDKTYTDLFAIHLKAGQRITVEMTSDDFDTYLSVLRGPGDNLIDNDDIEPGKNENSRLTYRAPADAKLFIAATTTFAKKSGSYTLQVTDSSGDHEEPGPTEATKN